MRENFPANSSSISYISLINSILPSLLLIAVRYEIPPCAQGAACAAGHDSFCCIASYEKKKFAAPLNFLKQYLLPFPHNAYSHIAQRPGAVSFPGVLFLLSDLHPLNFLS